MLKIRMSRGGAKKDQYIKLLLQTLENHVMEGLLKKLDFLILYYQKIKKKD